MVPLPATSRENPVPLPSNGESVTLASRPVTPFTKRFVVLGHIASIRRPETAVSAPLAVKCPWE